MTPRPARSTLFPYTTLFRSWGLYRKMDPSVIPATHAALVELWQSGQIDPLIGAELPLADAPEALARLADRGTVRSEEHTSELQSRQYLVCRLLLEKKKKVRC